MGYTDYLRDEAKPTCWGSPRSYDKYDPECCGCRYKTSCAAAVERELGYTPPSYTPTRVPVQSTPHYSSHSDEVYRSRYTAAQIDPGETALERFVKDATAGALRGAFWEMYQFWKNHRIK